MLAWNASFLLLALALCFRVLPRNEWLSAAVLSLALGFASAAAGTSAAAVMLRGESPTTGDRLLWIGMIGISAMCLKAIVSDLLPGRAGEGRRGAA